jgi:hypothetical protein
MLVRALLDIATASKQKDEQQNKRDALKWMRSNDDPSYIFSFANCCQMLHLSSERMLLIALAYSRPGSPQPIDPSSPLERLSALDSQLSDLPPLLSLIRDKRRALNSQIDFED